MCFFRPLSSAPPSSYLSLRRCRRVSRRGSWRTFNPSATTARFGRSTGETPCNPSVRQLGELREERKLHEFHRRGNELKRILTRGRNVYPVGELKLNLSAVIYPGLTHLYLPTVIFHNRELMLILRKLRLLPSHSNFRRYNCASIAVFLQHPSFYPFSLPSAYLLAISSLISAALPRTRASFAFFFENKSAVI